MRICSAWADEKEDRPVILFATESSIARMNKLKYIDSPIRKDDEASASENGCDVPMEQ